MVYLRYDKEVYFVSESEPIRLPNGDWTDEETTKQKIWANVTDTGDETLALLFGNITQQSLTIRIQNHYDADFNHIEVDGVKYKVLRERKLRRDQVFIVGELQ